MQDQVNISHRALTVKQVVDFVRDSPGAFATGHTLTTRFMEVELDCFEGQFGHRNRIADDHNATRTERGPCLLAGIIIQRQAFSFRGGQDGDGKPADDHPFEFAFDPTRGIQDGFERCTQRIFKKPLACLHDRTHQKSLAHNYLGCQFA